MDSERIDVWELKYTDSEPFGGCKGLGVELVEGSDCKDVSICERLHSDYVLGERSDHRPRYISFIEPRVSIFFV